MSTWDTATSILIPLLAGLLVWALFMLAYLVGTAASERWSKR